MPNNAGRDEPIRVYIGYDRREDLAYRVCAFSLMRRASRPIEIRPLVLETLRQSGLYSRPDDPLASTEFTYSRFLVPHLAGRRGWALFCDCDFLFLADPAALFAHADARYAAMVVKHRHEPEEGLKMDRRVQTRYPRKNWSSLVLWNCAHPAHAALSPEAVSALPGAELHRFGWLDDALIGALPEGWNWLEGASPTTEDGDAHDVRAVHFTRGGPWFADWRDVAFADAWRAERAAMERVGA